MVVPAVPVAVVVLAVPVEVLSVCLKADSSQENDEFKDAKPSHPRTRHSLDPLPFLIQAPKTEVTM